ncbi:YcaO-like family protein [Halorussus gelatinilyticus]|uniref:YcaO-like family protein n=1 Tax=Halorussus gelatinilyticus TaxID=2937524 RepID=A0A8U0IHY3_9EURY|nr:YcaO-like family protein [Halorussus gelatinilyticus]UPW00613.1 YcaO-like family protein [Halorussus gelatinilyticus]
MNAPTVGLVGEGPAIDAVAAALADVDAETVECAPEQVAGTDFAVVVGDADDHRPADDRRDARFAAANHAARDGGTPWLAVEHGGVGGHSLQIAAAVSGFAPGTACWDCLRTRVAANLDAEREASDDAESVSEETDSAGSDPASARFAGALAGREAATLLSGGESRVLGGVVEVPHAERNVLPVPGCAVCDDESSGSLGLSPSLDRAYADTELEGALARAERAVDERVGLVSTIGEAESFPAPYYLAQLADTSGFSDAQAAEQAAGVADDWNAALMKALGEALERYAAGVYREAGFRTARAADFDAADSVVPPAEFVRPEGWSDASADDELAWVEGRNLHRGEAVHLPAEFVHFPPPEVRHKPSITTGLGLGSSTVEALLAGLYEVIERDATMLSWYSTFDPLELAVEDERFDALRSRARAENLEVTPLLVTQDADVPVVAVAVHREGAWPRFAVGSDADLDPEAAATAALAEALQNWMELRSMGEDDAADADGAIGRYADFPDTAREFVAADTSIPAASVGPADPPVGEAELHALLGRLADADLSAYAARLTTRDVERLGFEAVRVLVPAAQPLFTGESFFGERSREVPPELGFEFRPDRDLHPYP